MGFCFSMCLLRMIAAYSIGFRDYCVEFLGEGFKIFFFCGKAGYIIAGSTQPLASLSHSALIKFLFISPGRFHIRIFFMAWVLKSVSVRVKSTRSTPRGRMESSMALRMPWRRETGSFFEKESRYPYRPGCHACRKPWSQRERP